MALINNYRDEWFRWRRTIRLAARLSTGQPYRWPPLPLRANDIVIAPRIAEPRGASRPIRRNAARFPISCRSNRRDHRVRESCLESNGIPVAIDIAANRDFYRDSSPRIEYSAAMKG